MVGHKILCWKRWRVKILRIKIPSKICKVNILEKKQI